MPYKPSRASLDFIQVWGMSQWYLPSTHKALYSRPILSLRSLGIHCALWWWVILS